MSSCISDLKNNPAPQDSLKQLKRATVTEFVATCLFVYIGTLSALSTGTRLVGNGEDDDVARILPIAVSFGIAIMGLAHSIGHISGGHMNPAVTFLMYLRRQVSAKKMFYYWLAQFLGALLASALAWGSVSSVIFVGDVERPPFLLGATTLEPSINTGNGFLLEFMGSAVFFFVIAQATLDKKGISSTSFPAVSIGFTLIAVHVCLIPFTGCGINPARTFGPSIVTCMSGSRCKEAVGSWYWIYFLAPMLAAFFVAEFTLWLKNAEDGDEETIDEVSKPNSFKSALPGDVEEFETPSSDGDRDNRFKF